jgi:hypothetical protein
LCFDFTTPTEEEETEQNVEEDDGGRRRNWYWSLAGQRNWNPTITLCVVRIGA